MSIYRIVDDRFRQMIDESAGFEVLAQGFAFTEGTTWHPREHHVTFSDIPSSRLHRRFADTGEIEILRDPSNMTNGTTYDRQGRLLMCEHESSKVTRLEADGAVTVLADRWEDGKELNSPNDIVADARDGIWFTDPLYGRQKETGVVHDAELSFCGVFHIAPDGTLHLIDDDYAAPNGLCFSPDRKRLYVNDSTRQHIRVYAMDGGGRASGGEVFAETRDIDGMKVDAGGNVWCTGPGGINVFDTGGNLLGIVLTPQFPANFCFGGDDLCDLFVAAGTTLVRLRVAKPGHALFNPA